MKTNYPQMILRAENSHFSFAEGDKLRARVEILFATNPKLCKTRVEIDLEFHRVQIGERAFSAFVVLPANASVDVTVRTKALFRVIASSTLAFDQNGLYAHRVEEGKNFRSWIG